MTHIQQRRGASAVWTSVNPVLMEGESGHETDTGREKMGDGTTAWNALPYKFGVDSVAGKTGIVELEVADVEGAAPLENPYFSGTPRAPSPSLGSWDDSLATTDFVKAQGYATLESPEFTGNPTVPTPSVSDDDLSVANTEFVKNAIEDAEIDRAADSTWQDFTPQWVNGTTVSSPLYARLRVINGDTCHIQVHVGAISSSSLSPGFLLPYPPAARYDASGLAPGSLLKFFPGTFRWADISDGAGLGVVGLLYRAAAGPTPAGYYIGGALANGNSVNFTSPIDHAYWETTYEIEAGSV